MSHCDDTNLIGPMLGSLSPCEEAAQEGGDVGTCVKPSGQWLTAGSCAGIQHGSLFHGLLLATYLVGHVTSS